MTYFLGLKEMPGKVHRFVQTRHDCRHLTASVNLGNLKSYAELASDSHFCWLSTVVLESCFRVAYQARVDLSRRFAASLET